MRKKNCKGFGGAQIPIAGQGTIKWKLLDDNGVQHVLLIKKALFIPKATMCLLSPQHVDKSLRDTSNNNHRLKKSTDSKGSVIQLTKGDNKYEKTVYHNARTNTPVFTSAPDNVIFNNYCMECEEETKSNELEVTVSSSEFIERSNNTSIKVITNGNDQIVASTDEGELMRWHYRLGHLSWHKLKLLALFNIIRRRLATLHEPRCPCCIAAQMSKIPTRTKGTNAVRNIQVADHPGQYVSVDQMECSTPGFVAQLKGRLTRKRYRVTTVYIDHQSDLTFTFNQESTTSLETLASKHAFEAFAREKGIPRIQHYHSDNGRFMDNAFVIDCRKQGQSQSACGVNAHHQNGRVEKRIRDLSDDARKSLIHAVYKWNGVVSTVLWPYAFRHAAVVMNTLPDKKD
jgi:hypothetical protein